jgi:hypothetical protein
MGASAWELLFKIAVGLVGALGATILKTTWDEIRSIRDDQASLRQSLPGTYARRDDVRDGFNTITATLSRIEDKLDRKVDRV